VALLQAAAAQMATGTSNVRDLSTLWAEYYAKAYRVPVDLVDAIIDEESGWNPYAVSKKGAVGLMQLMPRTALAQENGMKLRIVCPFAKDYLARHPELKERYSALSELALESESLFGSAKADGS
jgi:soluble lytic murein transglycosylase-like protein